MTVMDLSIARIGVMVTRGVMRSITVIITVAYMSPYILIVVVPGLIYMRWVYNTGIGSMIESQKFD